MAQKPVQGAKLRFGLVVLAFIWSLVYYFYKYGTSFSTEGPQGAVIAIVFGLFLAIIVVAFKLKDQLLM